MDDENFLTASEAAAFFSRPVSRCYCASRGRAKSRASGWASGTFSLRVRPPQVSRANANHHYGEIAKYFNKLRDKFFISPSGSCSRLPSEWKLRSTNMLLIMHRVCRPALPAALLLIGMSAMGITDAAAQGSPEARQLARRMRCGFVRNSLQTCLKPRNA